MKNFFRLLLLISFTTLAQNKEINLNYIVTEQKGVYFYKDSWNPFTGNVTITDEELKRISKIKVINGEEILLEEYDYDGKLVRKTKNGLDMEVDGKEQKSEFGNDDKFVGFPNIKHITVLMRYINNSKTRHKEKINGFIKFEYARMYFKDGVNIKTEYFHDEECKNIKESYEIFHTSIGNPIFEEESQSYDGKYKKWDANGKVIAKGKYKMGKLIYQ